MDTKRTIRLAQQEEIPSILSVMEAARQTMRAIGNPQWPDTYPSADIISNDIDKASGFVIVDEGMITGYFAFLRSPEPTYSTIYNGEWMDAEQPYHVIHRIASFPTSRGIFKDIMDYCFSIEKNIRIDTHRKNIIMQHLLLKNGFSYCGIIHLLSGDERLAYQRIDL